MNKLLTPGFSTFLRRRTRNLLYDIGQTGIPFDNVDAELVTKPLQWNPADIGCFMLFFGPISSLLDITTFAVMWWVFDADSVARQTRPRSSAWARSASSSGSASAGRH